MSSSINTIYNVKILKYHCLIVICRFILLLQTAEVEREVPFHYEQQQNTHKKMAKEHQSISSRASTRSMSSTVTASSVAPQHTVIEEHRIPMNSWNQQKVFNVCRPLKKEKQRNLEKFDYEKIMCGEQDRGCDNRSRFGYFSWKFRK